MASIDILSCLGDKAVIREETRAQRCQRQAAETNSLQAHGMIQQQQYSVEHCLGLEYTYNSAMHCMRKDAAEVMKETRLCRNDVGAYHGSIA
jgi:hypothetical protein